MNVWIKKFLTAIVLAGLWGLMPLAASELTYEDELARAMAQQVNRLARQVQSLDGLGQNVVSQSAVVLDLGPRAARALGWALADEEADWKMRYWAADLLGDVGEPSALGFLTQVAQDLNEPEPLRKCAKQAAARLVRRLRSRAS